MFRQVLAVPGARHTVGSRDPRVLACSSTFQRLDTQQGWVETPRVSTLQGDEESADGDKNNGEAHSPHGQ